MRGKIRNPKQEKRWRRHMRVRDRVIGTSERPRLCVFRSNHHIYVQIIDDTEGRTLASVSSLKISLSPRGVEPGAEKDEKKGGKKKGKKDQVAGGRKTLQAREVGRLVAEAAKAKGITKVAFDRGGYLYHGRVAALAAAARDHGLEF